MYIDGMEPKKDRKPPRASVLAETVFFCVYWGAYAVAWHFAATVRTSDGGFALYDIGIMLHALALAFYAVGAVLVLADAKDFTSGRSR